AAELRLERGRETLPGGADSLRRVDRASLPGRIAHPAPLAAAGASRRAVGEDLSLARARHPLRRSPDRAGRAGRAARPGLEAPGAAGAGNAAALLPPRGAAAVRRARQAARQRAAPRRAEPRAAQAEPFLHA